MIVLTGYLTVPESDLAAVRGELATHRALTLAEPGCLRFDVTPCANAPHRFAVSEAFTDRAAFEAHQDRVRASRWGRLTINAERHYDIVEYPGNGETRHETR